MHTPRRLILRELLVSAMVQWLLLVSSLVSLLPCSSWWRCIWNSDHHGNSKVARECTVRRWWHDALRRLCNPAEGHGFSRALGFFLMGFAAAIVFISILSSLVQHFCFLLIGFGIAFWDYQLQTKMKNAAPAVVAGGDFEDGI